MPNDQSHEPDRNPAAQPAKPTATPNQNEPREKRFILPPWLGPLIAGSLLTLLSGQALFQWNFMTEKTFGAIEQRAQEAESEVKRLAPLVAAKPVIDRYGPDFSALHIITLDSSANRPLLFGDCSGEPGKVCLGLKFGIVFTKAGAGTRPAGVQYVYASPIVDKAIREGRPGAKDIKNDWRRWMTVGFDFVEDECIYAWELPNVRVVSFVEDDALGSLRVGIAVYPWEGEPRRINMMPGGCDADGP